MGREENVTSDSGSDARDGPGPRDSASPSRLGRMPCVNCHLCCQHPNFFRGRHCCVRCQRDQQLRVSSCLS